MSAPKVERTDPALWEVCKQDAVTKLGKFSARAMQHAVKLYIQRGGGYVGAPSPANALVRWSRAQEEVRKSRDDG